MKQTDLALFMLSWAEERLGGLAGESIACLLKHLTNLPFPRDATPLPSYSARQLEAAELDQWQALWDGSRRLLGTHGAYLRAAARGAGHPVFVGVFDEKGKLVGGVPFVARKHRLFESWRHPVPIPFAGLMIRKEETNESAIREMLATVARFVAGAVPLAEMVFPPGFEDARPLVWEGWEARPHYNYVNEIKEEDGLLLQAENAARRQGKKAAESLGVAFGDDNLETLFRMWKATRSRQGIPPYVTEECFRELSEWLGKGGNFSRTIAIVKEGDAPLAGGFFVGDAERVYYLLGASSEGSQGTGAPSLLHFALTDHVYKTKGPFLYDWVGANTPSVAQFKKKFRPKLEASLRLVWRGRWAKRVVNL